jgi:enoyl-CoA hydratase/carnithine racemase
MNKNKVYYKLENKIATIVMDSDEQNTIDGKFIADFRSALREILSTDAKVVVIESAREDFFCNGFHPDVFLGASGEQIKQNMKDLLILGAEHFFYPLPTISVVTGYAAGGGAFIATYNDFRFMSKKKSRIGFTEVHLAMTVPSTALEILAIKIGYQNVIQTTLLGKLLKAEECLKYNLVDEIFETHEETKQAAYKLAKQIASLPVQSLKSLKKGSQRWIKTNHFEEQMEKDLKEVEELMLHPDCMEAFSALKEKRKPKFTS